MLAGGHVAGETEIGRRAAALANDLIAFAGLLVLGFPVTTATIRIVMVSWVLITIAFIQVALMYFQPLLRFEEIGNESY